MSKQKPIKVNVTTPNGEKRVAITRKNSTTVKTSDGKKYKKSDVTINS
jgi:hypothetical protein